MSSGADLFVVCKQCGSEVSPYITECPYCGHRLRRRAPKLPRARDLGGSPSRPRRRWSMLGRVRAARSRARRPLPWEGAHVDTRPYATIALVAVSCLVWVAWRGGFVELHKLVILGPLSGDWWKLITSQFAYDNGFYEFVTLVAIAIFGWLMERRHGALVVLALFLGAGVAGALVASAVYPDAVVSGGSRRRAGPAGGMGGPGSAGCAGWRALRGRSPRRGGDRRGSAGDAVRTGGSELVGGRHRWARRTAGRPRPAAGRARRALAALVALI